MADIEVTPRPRTAREWFTAATRGYSEKHQACPCCRARHCVFRAQWGSRIEYHCSECDFSTAFDEEQKTFAVALGDASRKAPPVVPGLRESSV